MSRFSPLRYPGGKAVLSPALSSIITDNGYSKHYYAEPFAGGAYYINNKFLHPLVITYDNVNEISDLYKSQKLFVFKCTYSTNLHKKGREIMIFLPQINIDS